MKIKCPKCEAGYNISDEKIIIEVTKLKCTKCEFTFIVSQENIIETLSKNELSQVLDSDILKTSENKEEKWILEAQRLAEVIVSDIHIYNKEKIKDCKTDEEIVITLGAELKKGRNYYLEKVNPNLKDPNKYYAKAVRTFLKIKKQ